MNRRFQISAFVLAASSLPCTAQTLPAEESAPVLRITVRLFDYALVPSAPLATAQEEAGRIFQRAGIGTSWITCLAAGQEAGKDSRCTAKTKATDMIVRITPHEMADLKRHNEFGVAHVPRDGRFGKHAGVFYGRVEEYAERWQASSGLLLGHLIAHEIGHLLLGANSHAPSGIMKAPWTRKQIERASLGTLLFTPEEATRMQQQILERIATDGGQVDGSHSVRKASMGSTIVARRAGT